MTSWTCASAKVRGLRAPLLVLAFFGASFLTPLGRADAQEADDPVAKITQMNKDAIVALQAQKWDDARKLLKQGLDLADASGLQQHPITARTHIHMGVVLISGFKQRDLGIKQFKKALEIEATINLTKSLVTPELTEAFNEAKAGGAAPAATPPATAPAPTAPPPANPEPPPPPPPAAPAEPAAPAASPEGAEEPSGIVHEPITEAKKGSTISVTVGVQADLKFDKMVLAYRPAGATEFNGREMKEVAEGRYGAEIPTTATGGDSVDYYVEADDAEGNAVATKGTVDSPLSINLGGAKAAHNKPEGGEEEEDEEPDHTYFVGLMLGSGFGWATGVGDTNHDTSIKPPGLALATLFQVAPEVGYWLTDALMLSIQLRYQHVTGTVPAYNPFTGEEFKGANYAFAAFAKATWKLGDDDSDWHPFFSLAAGGGYIRHEVTLHPMNPSNFPPNWNCGPKGTQDCVDTIQGGPILIGPGGGVFYDLTDNLQLVGQANAVLGFWNFTFNLDINVGIAYGF
jgi:hypothetical protein